MRTRFSLKPLVLVALAVLLQPQDSRADSLGKQWWVRDAQEQQKAQQSQADDTVVVPGYFAEQPKPFERPAEIILPKTPSYGGLLGSPFAGYRTPILGGSLSAGILPYAPAIPYVGSSIPYIAPTVPYSSVPYIGSSILSAVPYRGFGGFGLGLGGIGLGVPGIGVGMPGIGVGLSGIGLGVPGIGVPGIGYSGIGTVPYTPFGGFGPYAGFGAWNPQGSALFMGAMGNRLNNSKLGQVGSARVIQTAPSKASGNYYAPSNVDTTAAGSYYATTSPAIIPYMKPKKAPESYWGGGGSPFKDVNLNSTPWSK